jgi:hypothetical protein
MTKRKNSYPDTRATRQVIDECVDCHSEFERSVFATQKVRCDLCQQERNRINLRLSVARARQRTKKGMKPVKADHWNCEVGKCKHFDACKTSIRADRGCSLPCFEGVAPIPVVGHDVTSEFDGISITLSVWREQR